MGKSSSLNDEHFLYGFAAEYLDGELRGDNKRRYDELLRDPNAEQIPEQFQRTRGQLQFGMQGYYVDENMLLDLRGLIQDSQTQVTIEKSKIHDLEVSETAGSIRRRLVMLLIAAGIVGAGIWLLTPEKTAEFKPLDYLGYEALAMEEDATGRLDFPSKNIEEIAEYISSYPGLGFQPQVLRGVGGGWEPEGSSVIDYEVAKVVVVQFGHPRLDEKAFHFSFAGTLQNLPKSEQAKKGEFRYQAYENNELNFIAWERPGFVSLLVGRRSALELVEIAQRGDG